MPDNPVTILIDGDISIINEKQLTIGDLVMLQVGDIAPADITITESVNLEIDEFDITGEILPVVKTAKKGQDLIYAGSKIVRGYGIGRVVALGKGTEFWKITHQKRKSKKQSKFVFFDRRFFGLGILLVPALILRFRSGSKSLPTILEFGFYWALVVILQNTDLFNWIITSWSGRYYKKTGVPLENPRILNEINNIDYFCFDKTGVLTSRQLEVEKVYFPENQLFDEINSKIKDRRFFLVRKGAALCNDVYFYEKTNVAHPIDQALIRFAQKLGADIKNMMMESQLIFDEPFDSEKRFMMNGFTSDNGANTFFAKGDPEVILPLCKKYINEKGNKAVLDHTIRSRLLDQINSIVNNGDTVIALAYEENKKQKPEMLCFLCLFQLGSPISPQSYEITNLVKENGMRPLLLTGDRSETAIRVAQEIDITNNPNEYLTGKMIAKMPLNEVARQSLYCPVFARLMPSQKAVLIRLFQRQGKRCLMVGDGANDSIAIKVADIGVSYVEHSSPIARKFASILINDLGDLIKLIKDSIRIKRLLKLIKVLQYSAITLIIVKSYI